MELSVLPILESELVTSGRRALTNILGEILRCWRWMRS